MIDESSQRASHIQPVQRLRSRVLAVATAWGFTASLIPLPVAGEDLSERYFDQLRRRGLFSLAEGYCLKQLARSDLAASKRTALTLQLSQTFAEHARFSTGGEQADLWKRAQQVITEFVSQHPQHSQRLLLDAQGVFVLATRAEHLRWRSELFPFDRKLIKRTQSELQAVIPQLVELQGTLEMRVRTSRNSEASASDAPTAYDLRRLLGNVRYRLGVCYLELAKLQTDSSPDRAAALRDAESALKGLASGTPGLRITWNSQLLLAEAARLSADWKRSESILATTKKANPPADILERIVAGEIRLLLAAKQFPEAAQAVVDWQRKQGSVSGELRFLNVRALLELRQLVLGKQQPSLAAELLEQVQAYIIRAESEVGGFWAYRCRQLLNQALSSSRYGVELAAMIDKAKSLYAAGRSDNAITAYADAVIKSLKAGHNELAWDLGYTRASILLHERRYQEAADAFHELPNRLPSNSRAARAHLLWAYCLGILYRQDQTRSRHEGYVEALTAHRRQFANDPTAVEATWLLAQLQEQSEQPTKALVLYLQIPLVHQRGMDARLAVARCYESVLERLRDPETPGRELQFAGRSYSRVEWEQQAIDRLESYVRGFATGNDQPSAKHCGICIRLAHIYLNQANANFKRADQLLEFVFSSVPTAQPGADTVRSKEFDDLMRTAIQLRIISLAGQERANEARSLVDKLSQDSPAQILSVLDGLMQLTPSIDQRSQGELGELQLQTSETLNSRRSELNESQLQQLDRCLAQAFAATRQPRKAISVYQRLLAKTPGDKSLLAITAGLMDQVGTDDYLAKAKTLWRKLESLEEPGSSGWLRARYQIARSCFALKQFRESRKLLGVTRLLYPELGGAELQSKFARLEADLKRATK